MKDHRKLLVFEAFSNSTDLMNQILHADDTIFMKRSGIQSVICQDNLLLIDFAKIMFTYKQYMVLQSSAR